MTDLIFFCGKNFQDKEILSYKLSKTFLEVHPCFMSYCQFIEFHHHLALVVNDLTMPYKLIKINIINQARKKPFWN